MPFVSYIHYITHLAARLRKLAYWALLLLRTLRNNSAMPMTANVAEAPNLMTSRFPFNVLHRDFDFIASQIAGVMGKLHMTSIMAFGVIGTTVSITMVI